MSMMQPIWMPKANEVGQSLRRPPEAQLQADGAELDVLELREER